MIVHPLPPIYDKDSRVLILGSFPSVRSRREMFYYGHPQNRFWKVVAAVCGEALPETVEAKRALLLRYNIAVWDVIGSCDIDGSADRSIRNAKPNDLSVILGHAPVEAIYVNGSTAFKYFNRYMKPTCVLPAVCLPSTSPANAAWDLERLTAEWRQILRTSGADNTAIRPAVLSDARRLLEIYDYYVRNTAITFEYSTPSLEEFSARMEHTMARYPYLVIESDGKVEGYAYAGIFKDRDAYSRSCEVTIYLDRGSRRRGLGRKLYAALENELKQRGFLNLYACIAYPPVEDEYLTVNSAEFHAHLGYTKTGEFHKCGYKFGRWYDMIWMEKLIGPHEPS